MTDVLVRDDRRLARDDSSWLLYRLRLAVQEVVHRHHVLPSAAADVIGAGAEGRVTEGNDDPRDDRPVELYRDQARHIGCTVGRHLHVGDLAAVLVERLQPSAVGPVYVHHDRAEALDDGGRARAGNAELKLGAVGPDGREQLGAGERDQLGGV